MAEGNKSTLLFETNNDSVLSGFVCYSTELNEDGEVLSEAETGNFPSFNI